MSNYRQQDSRDAVGEVSFAVQMTTCLSDEYAVLLNRSYILCILGTSINDLFGRRLVEVVESGVRTKKSQADPFSNSNGRG